MNLQDLHNLISIRNHLNNVLNGLGGGVDKKNKKDVAEKVSFFDKIIIQETLNLNLMPDAITIKIKSTEFDENEWNELIKNKSLITESINEEQINNTSSNETAPVKKGKVSRSV